MPKNIQSEYTKTERSVHSNENDGAGRKLGSPELPGKRHPQIPGAVLQPAMKKASGPHRT